MAFPTPVPTPTKFPRRVLHICTGSYDIRPPICPSTVSYTNKAPGGVRPMMFFPGTEAGYFIERIIEILAIDT